MNLLFVCTGNTCRSPMAEAYFRQLCRIKDCNSIRVASAGVCAIDGADASEEAKEIMAEQGVKLGAFCSTKFTLEAAERMDLIVCMSLAHLDIVRTIVPGIRSELLLLEGISDPYGGSSGEYRRCFERMKLALDTLFDRLK